MLNTISMILSSEDQKEIFDFAEKNSALAKNLYNAALFRIRQVFTGWGKEHLTDNEQEIADEIKVTLTVYPRFKAKRVLNYNALDKILRANKNPDFFSGLPMQTAQAVVRAAATDFSNWLKAMKQYKKDPSDFTGCPKMPGYKKSKHILFTVTNQDAVLYPSDDEDTCLLKLPGYGRGSRFPLRYVSADMNLRQISFKPYYGKYILMFVIEDMAPFFHPDLPECAGVDFGTDNIAAIACTDQSSVVYKGGAILSENRLFAKSKGKAVSVITKGHDHMHASSRHLDNLSLHHACFMKDQMHKISRDIVDYCVAHKVGTLVLGVNKLWKQCADIGKVNNQNFVSIPHATLRWMIQYKALSAGITVIEQEESYTSKADVTAKDFIPTYGKNDSKCSFSGNRTARGSYRCHDGNLINADCNGAANILRKAFPDIWDHVNSFGFLAIPTSISFKTLTPVYRVA